jgi:hypothetical protein
MSTTEFNKLKRQFRKNPTINPETGRTISENGNTYKNLVEKYGLPTNHRSPKRTKTAKSPKRSSQRKNDPFVVLSDESILRVLQKLSPENRQIWCQNSAHVNSVCTKNNLL